MQDLLLVMLSLWSPETRRSSNSDGFPCFSFIFLHSLISPWKPQKEETDITFLGDDDDDGLGNGPHQKIFFATVPPDLFQFMVPAPSLRKQLLPSCAFKVQIFTIFGSLSLQWSSIKYARVLFILCTTKYNNNQSQQGEKRERRKATTNNLKKKIVA